MSALSDTVAGGFANYYEMMRDKINQLAGPVVEGDFWRRPYPYGNSVGHLILHLTGNLQYFIGARIAGTGYIRDRDREFTDNQPPSKDAVLKRWNETIDMVVATIGKQAPEDWGAAYTAERETDVKDRFTMILRCAAHAYHHVGQIMYLQKELGRAG